MGDPYVQPGPMATHKNIFQSQKTQNFKSDEDFKKEKYSCLPTAIRYCIYHIEKDVYIQINVDYDSTTDVYVLQAKAIFLSGSIWTNYQPTKQVYIYSNLSTANSVGL